MPENNQTRPALTEVTPSLIRDILNLRTTDVFGIFETFASSVEQNLNLQDNLDALIEQVNDELSRDSSTLNELGNDLIDAAFLNPSRTVREAIVNIGTSFGSRQKEELGAYFNLLNTVDMSRAVRYIDVGFYDKRLYDFFKSIDNYDQNSLSQYFKASKFLYMSDFMSPQTFDIGNNVTRLLFSPSEELSDDNTRSNLGFTTTALRSFPRDLIPFLRQRLEENSNEEALGVFSSFLSDFGVRELNDLMSPFVSLVSVEMRSQEQAAFIDFYQGTMVIKLHDVKLLPIIQPLLEPNRTLCRMTFGWNHPDPSTITGAIMNLKTTLDFTIYNYTIKFDENMEATINLNFRSNAVENLNRQTFLRNNAPAGTVTENSGIRDRIRRLEDLLSQIRRQKESVLERLGSSNEVTEATAALNASTSVSSFLQLVLRDEDPLDPTAVDFTNVEFEDGFAASGDALQTLQRLNEALTLADSVAEDYRDLANRIIEEIWERGSVRALRERAEQEGDQALQRLTQIYASLEQVANQDRLQAIRRSVGQSRGLNSFEDEYAPLSEILNQFFFNSLYEGPPEGLERGEGDFRTDGADASTVIYFRANPSAGLFSNAPIGSFLIHKEEFKEIIENYIEQTGKLDITITDLISTLMSNIFSRKNDINYGFSVFFDEDSQLRSDVRTGQAAVDQIIGLGLDNSTTAYLLSQVRLNNRESNEITNINISTVNPKIIAIDRRVFTNYNRFTENLTLNEGTTDIQESVDVPSEKIFIVYDDNEDGDARYRVENEIVSQTSIDISLADISPEQKIELKKDAARRLFPTLYVRKNETSIIKNIDVGIEGGDQLLETILMTQQDYNYSGNLYQTPLLDQNEFGNPFFFARMPKVNVTLMGLPRIQKHQYIFIDFGSNTNLDNIYYVVNVDHSIDQNGFETKLELMFNDVFSADLARNTRTLNQTYEESDEAALGARDTFEDVNPVEEFDSRIYSALEFATLGYIGDNISFSSSDAERFLRQAPAGGTWSYLQFATLGYLGDNIRVNSNIANREPRNPRGGRSDE